MVTTQQQRAAKQKGLIDPVLNYKPNSRLRHNVTMVKLIFEHSPFRTCCKTTRRWIATQRVLKRYVNC